MECEELQERLGRIESELRELSGFVRRGVVAKTNAKKYLTLSELAVELGIPRDTLYKRILPYHQIGGEGRKYYVKDEVLDYKKYPTKYKYIIAGG